MEKQIVTIAKAAKVAGYLYLYSTVKSVYKTKYYNVVSIDDIIAANGWIAAPQRNFGWHGPVGVTAKNLPANAIHRKRAEELFVNNKGDK